MDDKERSFWHGVALGIVIVAIVSILVAIAWAITAFMGGA